MSDSTFRTYDQVGKKEDVSNIISNITPTATPFQSAIPSDPVKNILYQWQEDSLRDVKANAQLEGFTAAANAVTPTNMRSNTTQIIADVISISRSSDKIATYGRAQETAYQLAKLSKALKRDFEYALIGTGQTQVLGSDSTARQFAGVQAQIDSSMIFTAGTAANGSTAAVPGPLTEDLILDANEAAYTEGADISTIQIKPADARRVADFAYSVPATVTNTDGRRRDVGSGSTIVNAVDVYKSPYGTQTFVKNRFIRSTDALLFDPDMWAIAVFDPWSRTTLAKTGDATQMMIVGEFGLKHKNWKGSALITNLS